jgi:hypothetical protein
MSEVGIYSTGLKRCTLPHYDKASVGLTQDISLPHNLVFDAQKEIFDRYGHIMSPALLGICVADLFTTFGLSSKDSYVRDMFTPINCFTGKDTVVSYLVANSAYNIVEKDAFTPVQQVNTNIVFNKGCLIVPRGEILWSLLAYNANAIAIGDDPSDLFKIYVDRCGGDEGIDIEQKWTRPAAGNDDCIKYPSHYEFSNKSANNLFPDWPPDPVEPVLELEPLPVAAIPNEIEINRINEANRLKQQVYAAAMVQHNKDVDHVSLQREKYLKSIYSSENKNANETKFVYLNPNIYAKIKAFRCISPHNMSLMDQDFILYTMNLFYSQFFSTLALISTQPEILLMYPPATLEMICPKKPDTMVVALPRLQNGVVENIDDWTIREADIGYGLDVNVNRIISVPHNMILIADVISMNTCSETLSNTNRNVVEAIEHKLMSGVRDEYLVLKAYGLENTNLNHFNENTGRQFFKKIIKNSYPNKLQDDGTTISTFTPNCTLTPLGIVATKSICENDPLVIDNHQIDIKRIHVQPKTGWTCEIESVQLPTHVEEVSEIGLSSKKAGVLRQSDQRELKFPLNFSPHFVTAMGTNINIIPN